MSTKISSLFPEVQTLRRIAHQSPKFNGLGKISQFGIARQLVEDFQEASTLRLDIRMVWEILSNTNPPVINGRISPTALIPIQQSLTGWFQTNMATALAQTASTQLIIHI